MEMPTESVSNPAGEAVSAEIAEIAGDPKHPHYNGWKRGDQSAEDYVAALYKRVYGSGTVEIGGGTMATAPTPESGQGIAVTGSTERPPAASPPAALGSVPKITPEDRAAQAEVDAQLRQVLGDEYDTEMEEMGAGARHLFAMPEGQQVVQALSPMISRLGPEAEVASIRFLAHLGRLAQR